MVYRDRKDAGEKLARTLKLSKFTEPVVFGLARGGVPVAYEVAKWLEVSLNVIVVRKLGLPDFPELGFGAIAPGGVLVVDEALVDRFGLDHEQIVEVVHKEQKELIKRVKKYQLRPLGRLDGQTAIIVDDGVATGSTILAAVRYVKKLEPKRIVVAVPVCPSGIDNVIRKEADDFICLSTESFFGAVGQFYEEFEPTSDGEVVKILAKNGKKH